jgi:hypothetical protein
MDFATANESEHICRMIATASLLLACCAICFKSRRRFEVEIRVPRHQLNLLQQQATAGISGIDNEMALDESSGGPSETS